VEAIKLQAGRGAVRQTWCRGRGGHAGASHAQHLTAVACEDQSPTHATPARTPAIVLQRHITRPDAAANSAHQKGRHTRTPRTTCACRQRPRSCAGPAAWRRPWGLWP
jgi:hypothetical protein